MTSPGNSALWQALGALNRNDQALSLHGTRVVRRNQQERQNRQDHEGATLPSQIATALMTGRTMTRIRVGVVVTTVAVIEVGLVVVKLEVVVVAVDPGGVARIRLASGFGALENGLLIQTRTIITLGFHVYKN